MPTIFSHSKPLKRRLSSVNCHNDRAKKQLLEDAISNTNTITVEPVTNTTESDCVRDNITTTVEPAIGVLKSGCDNNNLIETVTSCSSKTYVDKEIDNTPKTKDAKSQCNLGYFCNNKEKKPSKPLLVKMPFEKQKKNMFCIYLHNTFL